MNKFFGIIFFLLLFKAANSQTGDYIIIKHIGDQPKAIWPIAIVKDKSDTTGIEEKMRFIPKLHLPLYTVLFLDTNTYSSIDSVIECYKRIMDTAKTPTATYRPYGSLGIRRYINQKEAYHFETYNKRQSYMFLDTLYNRFQIFHTENKIIPSGESGEGDLLDMLCRMYFAIHSTELLKKNPPPCGVLNQR